MKITNNKILITGGAWILFSDKILIYFVRDPDLLTRLQTFKGWFYVLVTAVLFYLLLKSHLVKIRELRPHLPIIAQTAFALSDEMLKAVIAGSNDYISKPFRKEQLLDLVRKHLSAEQ